MKFSLKKLMLIIALLGAIFMATTISAFATEAKLGQVKASSLRFRAAPSLGGREMGRISNGAAILIIDTVENGEWYKIVHNFKTGYVSAEFVVLRPDADIALGDGVSIGSNVNVRGEPSTTADIQSQLQKGDRVNIIGVSHDWFKVLHDGAIGFVRADFLTVEQPSTRVMAPQPEHPTADDDEIEPEMMDGDGDYGEGANEIVSVVEASAVAGVMTDIQHEIVAFAKSQLGKKYRYGSAGPSSFDCSGFTTFIFKNFGYKLNRSSAGQLSNGTPVSRNDLQVGDLVIFRDPKINRAAASHVGMYIGNNQFIHSSSRRGGVIITSLTENYYTRHFVGGRRIF